MLWSLGCTFQNYTKRTLHLRKVIGQLYNKRKRSEQESLEDICGNDTWRTGLWLLCRIDTEARVKARTLRRAEHQPGLHFPFSCLCNYLQQCFNYPKQWRNKIFKRLQVQVTYLQLYLHLTCQINLHVNLLKQIMYGNFIKMLNKINFSWVNQKKVILII